MASNIRRVPPAPWVMAQLYADYKRAVKDLKKVSFKDYLRLIGFVDPDIEQPKADTGVQAKLSKAGNLVAVPSKPILGTLRLIVLLVDFSDNVGHRPGNEYADMLFSDHTYLTGSMRDFYKEASCGKVDVVGSVHGWLRMPQPYTYYVDNKQGFGNYPRNAQRLAEDAVNAAIAAGVAFSPELDKLGQGTITGLFIVHAGQGAEVMPTKAMQNKHIWSHKFEMQNPVQVANGLTAVNYLMVPEDCRMGVCAHELGHLAFQWDDFYDPNYAEDGSEWDGAGTWDLMAGGSWNEGGTTPAHPAGLHKHQHGWVEMLKVVKTTTGVVIPPYGPKSGKVVIVKGKKFTSTQSLVLENRRRKGFDSGLAGDGLLVWRVDTKLEQNVPDRPAMLLIQADGKHNLEDPSDFNEGDAGDCFPGSDNVTVLLDHGDTSTSFPNKAPSKVKLTNIAVDQQSGNVTLDITIG